MHQNKKIKAKKVKKKKKIEITTSKMNKMKK